MPLRLQKRRKILSCALPAAGFAIVAVSFANSVPRCCTPSGHAYSSDSKPSGPALFHEKGCEHCHGAGGRGGGLGPDLSTVGKRLKKQQIEHQLHDGGAAMPAFRDVLQPDELKALVEFLHAKRKAPK